MLTGKQLAAYCEKVFANKWVYWYGTCGYACTKSLYNSKKKQYPNHYTAVREAAYMKDIANGKTGADCVGMIKSFFWTGGVFGGKNTYASNHCPDTSANGMINLCTQTGNPSSVPDIPGLVLWKSGHIGVYVGGGMAIEMKGFDYDCLRRKVSEGGWTKWGRLPASMISYDDECSDCDIPPEPEGDRDLRNGDEGADVKQLQTNLIRLGFDCGKWGADGEFGDCTEQSVEAFQRAWGVTVTGIYDATTRAAMEYALDALDTPPEQPRRVKIIGGQCYVRSAPNTSGRKLGIAKEGDILPWGGETSPDGWQLIEYGNENAWVSGKYARLIDDSTRGDKIVDISEFQPTIDYDALIGDTALIIMRAGIRKKDGKIYEDAYFQKHATELQRRGVRFGTYFYSQAKSVEEAKEEARMYWLYARDFKPLFWAIDAEKDFLTADTIKTFGQELREQGAERVGAYIANHLHQKYGYSTIRDCFDFTWIPRYAAIRPTFYCDLWQYTDAGQVDGISRNVDLNRITGDGKTLSWFRDGE